jgi:hypothetical protein
MNAIAVFIADLIPAKGSRYFPLGKKEEELFFPFCLRFCSFGWHCWGRFYCRVWLG